MSTTDTFDLTTLAAEFDRDRVYLARGVFDAATVARLEADFDRIVAQLVESGEPIDATWTTADSDPGQVVFHTHNVQNYSRNWADALADPRLLDIAAAILGDDLVLQVDAVADAFYAACETGWHNTLESLRAHLAANRE